MCYIHGISTSASLPAGVYTCWFLPHRRAKPCQSRGKKPEAGSGTGKFPSAPLLRQSIILVESAATPSALRGWAARPAKGATVELHRNERGQMLIMAAIELTLLLGLLALAADVGALFHSKRKMQAAADAAATAAALNDYNLNMGYTMQTDTAAADAAAKANGYTDGQNGVVVTVNAPPTDGYHQAPGYVEVIISKPDPLYFFKFFTGNSTATVAARAVAGDPAYSENCMWAQNQFYIKGSGCVAGVGQNGSTTSCVSTSPKGCGIYVDSSSSDAIYNNDNATVIDVTSINTPGGGSKFQTTPTPVSSGAGSLPAPYQNLPTPDPANYCVATTYNSNGTVKQQGNIYTGSSYTGGTLPSISESFTTTFGTANIPVTCFSASNVSIGNGTTNLQIGDPTTNGFFFFENGVKVNGYVTFGALSNNEPCGQNNNLGALIYNYAGTIQYRPNSYMTAYSMPCGPWAGIAVYQPASNTNALNLQFGNSGATGTSTGCSYNTALGTQVQNSALDGYIVAPTAAVNLQDEGGAIAVTGIQAYNIDVNSALITCNYNQTNANTTPFRNIALVE